MSSNNTTIKDNLQKFNAKVSQMDIENEQSGLESYTKFQEKRIFKKSQKDRKRQLRAMMRFTCKVVKVVGVMELPESEKKYRYALLLNYKEGEGLEQNIKIKFGVRKQEYFYDGKNLSTLLQKAKSSRIPTLDPFSREFIEHCILHTSTSIDKGVSYYTDLIKSGGFHL